MPDQIVLEWEVDVSGTPFGPVEAEALLGAVPLYTEVEADPVLGQFFGLTVASDVTANAGTTTTRTLTLNMTSGGGAPFAPPIFPCHYDGSQGGEIEPPYQLRRQVTLAGSFFPQNGLTNVPTTDSQIPSLNVGDEIQFLSQIGIWYEVAAVGSTSIDLTFAYTGVTKNTTAFKEVAAPVALDRLAVYSSSELDTNGVSLITSIPAGPGARSVELEYFDSTGAGPFEAEADLTGKRPATFVYDMPAGIDVATISEVIISGTGAFGNSIGQITIVELSDALPVIPPDTTPGIGKGSIEGTAGAIGITNTFVALTDEAQLLIARHLVYLPPSYFALAQQGAATPMLAGDFFVTTGSTNVKTVEDQTGVLAAGNTVRFAFQPDKVYEVAAITPKILTLTEAFSGFDYGPTPNTLMPAGGSPNVRGTTVIDKATAAARVSPDPAAVPSNAALAGPLAQYVEPGVAMPPPNPPLPPATIPTPTFLSDLFTRTLQLGMKGVQVTPAVITFI